jgi:hypothetical protein
MPHRVVTTMLNTDPWYAEMAQRSRMERDRDFVPEAAPEPVPPPDDGTCRECFEWRYYPDGQRDLGQTWWLVCNLDCDHAHHDGEIWLARNYSG